MDSADSGCASISMGPTTKRPDPRAARHNASRLKDKLWAHREKRYGPQLRP